MKIHDCEEAVALVYSVLVKSTSAMGLFEGGVTRIFPIVQLGLSGLPQLRRHPQLGPLYTEVKHRHPKQQTLRGGKGYNEYHRPKATSSLSPVVRSPSTACARHVAGDVDAQGKNGRP